MNLQLQEEAELARGRISSFPLPPDPLSRSPHLSCTPQPSPPSKRQQNWASQLHLPQLPPPGFSELLEKAGPVLVAAAAEPAFYLAARQPTLSGQKLYLHLSTARPLTSSLQIGSVPTLPNLSRQ